jgi:hypothetical protein
MRQPSAVIQPLSRQNASSAPSVSTPSYRTPPLIDLHKVLKRKRGIVNRMDSATSIGSGPRLPQSKTPSDSVSRPDSSSEGYSLKRVKLDTSNTQTEVNLGGQMVLTTTQKENDNFLAAEDRLVTGIDFISPPNIQTDEHSRECFPVRAKSGKLDVQTCRTPETSHQQLSADGADYRSIETQQWPQPATPHSSVGSPPLGDSLGKETHVFPSVTALSARKGPLSIHDHPVSESHLPSSLATPRSLSQIRHTHIKSVLDDVVARLQCQPHHHNPVQPPNLLESKIRLPRLARWFKGVGTEFISTNTGDKRKRRKTSSAKATMVGLTEGWTFVSAQVAR